MGRRRQPTKRRVVFLDIDGVLVTWSSMEADRKDHDVWYANGFPTFAPECVARLNRITDALGADIVVSSTWRTGTREQFARVVAHIVGQGVTAKVIDRTPYLLYERDGYALGLHAPRGDEIKLWLEQNQRRVDGFVILDDDDDMEALAPWLVRTDMDGGLLDEHVDRAIAVATETKRGAA